MYGFPPRTTAWLLGLELTEFLGGAVEKALRTEALARFADELWEVVKLLDRVSQAKTGRGVPVARIQVQALRDGMDDAGLPLAERRIAEGKVLAMLDALDRAAEEDRPRR